MKIVITGAAGFIESFLCKRLLETTNDEVIGLDNHPENLLDFGYKPSTSLRDGLRRFAEWYRTTLYNGTFTQ